VGIDDERAGLEVAPREDFEHFYRSEHADAVRLAHLLTGSPTAAEDIVHDAFTRLHDRLPHLDRPAAYLRVTIVNLCRRWHRHRHREMAASSPNVEPATVTSDARELLDVLDALPYRLKAVLVLRYWADLSEADIADALGCRPGTVKTWAARGLARLRKELQA
jgi:RNA polymerase sigma-70 factor (sigma-E family)